MVGLLLAVAGTARASADSTPNGAAIIYNPGNGDFTGFRIVVARDGQAWASDGAGAGVSQLPAALSQELFADLAAVPLSQQPARSCPSDQPETSGTSIWVNSAFNRNSHVQRNAGLNCAADARILKLFDDAVAIERALYVHAYRTRPMVVFVAPGSVTGAAVVTGNSQCACTVPTGGVNFHDEHVDMGARFSNGSTFTGGRFTNGGPFVIGPFTTH